LVISGWLENKSQLALVCGMFGLSAAIRCRVTAMTEMRVELSTVDGGRLGVDLSDPAIEFRYAEPREFLEIEASGVTAAQKYASSVTALFPLRVRLADDPDDAPLEHESLSLTELIE
jgi:hypothetical protein